MVPLEYLGPNIVMTYVAGRLLGATHNDDLDDTMPLVYTTSRTLTRIPGIDGESIILDNAVPFPHNRPPLSRINSPDFRIHET